MLLVSALLLLAATAPCVQPAPPPLALVGATIYDGGAGEPLRDGVVVVRDGRIAAVGTRAEVALPADATVIDCAGRFLAPGLIDTHVHYSQTGWADGRPDACDVRATHPYAPAMADNELHPERFHRAFLASGVTAVFDVGGYPWTRRLGAATEHSPLAPHVQATGALLTTFEPAVLGLPDQKQFVLMADEETARSAVRSHRALGSAAIKVWFIVRPDLPVAATAPRVRAVGDECKKLGIPLVVHATTLETAMVAVEAGARLLVHSVEDREVDEAFVAACRAQGTSYCPTLTVRAGYQQLHVRAPSDEVAGQLPWVHPSVAARVRATGDLGGAGSAAAIAGMERRMAQGRAVMAKNLARLHAAGVPVVLGTDAGNPLTLHGPSVFPELEAMQAAGLSPAAVLVAATSAAAAAIGRGGDLGRIAKGCVADLVVLPADPGADIGALRALTHVCRAGVLHEREALIPR